MKQLGLAVLGAFWMAPTVALASESLWSTPSGAASRSSIGARDNELPSIYREAQADLAGFKYLLTANQRGQSYPLRLALPLPEGGFEYFLVEPSGLTPELFTVPDPDFLLFRGVAEDDPAVRVQLEYSSSFGITARVMDPQDQWFIGPMGGSQTDLSISYYKRNTETLASRQCGVDHEASAARPSSFRSGSNARDSGDVRRTYVIAVLTNGAYENYIYDSSKPDDLETQIYQAVGITLSRASGIYESEFSIALANSTVSQRALISNSVYDGYTSDNLDWVGEGTGVTTAIRDVIGDSFDVGHLFTAGGNSGIAYLGSVCDFNAKGEGETGGVNPVGDPFDVDYFSHELGHQFDANHIHQYCNDYGPTTVEPGSGSTIMGYAGICPPNVQSNSDPFFNVVNFEEVMAFVEVGTGSTSGCPAVGNNNGNAIPIVDAGQDYTIPRGMPFVLTGSASDADGDSLTYSWEQADAGNPLFRVRNPTSTPSRYFPQLGQASAFPETLPTSAQTLNFRLTARDGLGGRAWDAMQVTVVEDGDGFGAVNVNANGAKADVTWTVDATDQAPINASEVTFYLSTDSGASYPTQISSTTNDGQQQITFPSGIQSSTARLMVKATHNIFYAVSGQDFSVDSSATVDPAILWFITKPGITEE
jgi:hypothetical protein